MYKDSLSMETYIETIHVNKFRVSLYLYYILMTIEEGRHDNINRENQLCTHCNMNDIERINFVHIVT